MHPQVINFTAGIIAIDVTEIAWLQRRPEFENQRQEIVCKAT
jgi:hypothetical protein